MNTNPCNRRVLALAIMLAIGPLAAAAPGQGNGIGNGNGNGNGNTGTPRVHVDALADGESHRRFIVRFAKGTPEHANPQSALNSAGRGLGLGLAPVRRLAIGADLIEVDRALPPAAAEALMRALARNPNVEYIEPDARMQIASVPNDPRWSEQWHYFEATGGINLPAAWARSSGSGVRVAVIDTGIVPHTDLDANIIGGWDFISDPWMSRDGNGRDGNPRDEGDWHLAGECNRQYASNSSWHGTHVAGTVAAVTNNGRGIAGVAPAARVVPIRVLGRCGGTVADIADAIVWAAGGAVPGVPANPHPAEVINLSLGGGGACGSTYQSAIDGAVARGSTVVVAAGNSNMDVSGFRPANCNNVIAVAATTRQGARAGFSNFGSGIDVSAPGAGILSTWNSGTTVPAGESYTWMNGTSMAAPHVAGIVALMQAARPLPPAQVEAILKSTARPLPGPCSGGCGAGIVDARAAIDAALAGGSQPLANGVPVANLAGSAGSERRFTLHVPSGARDLAISIAGGSGDADLYVAHGSAPTTSSWLCRPYRSDSNESCQWAAPQAGAWHVLVRGYSAYSGVTLSGQFDANHWFENSTDYPIRDFQTTDSPIVVSGRSGNGPSHLRVGVKIVHSYIGDLTIDLIAPSGSWWRLHDRAGGSTRNIETTYVVDARTIAVAGTWRLRVHDHAANDVGYIDAWSLQF